MRFAHLGDLHLGKKVNSYSMVENQRMVLRQVVEKAVKKEVFTQTSLFELTESEAEPKIDPVIEKLKDINPLEVTPMDALSILYDLNKEVNNKK